MKTRTTSFLTDKIIHRIEFSIFMITISLINIPLIWGGWASDFSFIPTNFAAGEWWRIFTYSFAHVSRYHLFIDAGAFMLLYRGLLEPSWLKRTLYVIFCALGSLAAAMLSPEIFDGGLCGLSGVAHGLMTISTLEIAASTSSDIKLRRIGIIAFCIVVIKGIIEIVTGQVVFAFIHFGDVGTPLTLCHGGGILAGITAFLLLEKTHSAP